MNIVWRGRGLHPGVLLGVAVALAGAAHAQDGAAWLQKIYQASQKLSYTGTFVYQHGGQSEASRITRVVEGTSARERLEALDGVPREVVRTGDDVVCYFPASQMVKIDKQPGGRSLPAMLPEASISELWVYFADPWPKARHHKRGLINPPFLDAVLPLRVTSVVAKHVSR